MAKRDAGPCPQKARVIEGGGEEKGEKEEEKKKKRRVLLLDDCIADVRAVRSWSDKCLSQQADRSASSLRSNRRRGGRERGKEREENDIFRAEAFPHLRHAMRLVDGKTSSALFGATEHAQAAWRPTAVTGEKKRGKKEKKKKDRIGFVVI